MKKKFALVLGCGIITLLFGAQKPSKATVIMGLEATTPESRKPHAGKLTTLTKSAGRIIAPSSADNFNALIQTKPAIVKFYRTSCPACKSVKQIFATLSTAHNAVNFIEINVDREPGKQLAQRFGISLLPTFMFFKNGQSLYINHKGKTTDRIIGGNKPALERQIKNLI